MAIKTCSDKVTRITPRLVSLKNVINVMCKEKFGMPFDDFPKSVYVNVMIPIH